MYLRPGEIVVIVGATLTSLSTIVVALRYYSRHFLMRSMGASDHLMLVSLVLTWGNFVVNYYQDETSSKFRPSFLRMPEKRPLMEATLRGNLIAWWVYRMTYVVGLCFIKLSILWFYRAIASNRTFRLYVNCTIAFVCMYTFAVTIASAFQCENPSDSWSTAGYLAQFDRNPNTKPPQVKCYDPVKLWVFSAAANLLSDVIIMLLPIPALLSLRVPMSKRLALIGIFSIGIMAIIASSVRMWVMFLWAESPWNSARYGTDLLLWGQVESNSGIISASVPFLRMLFVSRRVEEPALPPPRKMSAPTPQEMSGQPLQKPLKVDTWALNDAEKGAAGQEGPHWQPFITVPESLSPQTSRHSMSLEPVHYPANQI